MHEFTNSFPVYGVLGNPEGPGPIELALYSANVSSATDVL